MEKMKIIFIYIVSRRKTFSTRTLWEISEHIFTHRNMLQVLYIICPSHGPVTFNTSHLIVYLIIHYMKVHTHTPTHTHVTVNCDVSADILSEISKMRLHIKCQLRESCISPTFQAMLSAFVICGIIDN